MVSGSASSAKLPRLNSRGSGDSNSRTRLRTATRWLLLLPEAIAVVLMTALALLLFAQVVGRSALGAPLLWSADIIHLLFVWVSLLGAAIAWKRRAHLHVAILAEKLPPRWQRVLPVLASLVAATVSVILIVQGWKATQQNMRQLLPMTGIAVGWLYLALPVSGTLFLLYSLAHLREDIVRLRSRSSGSDAHAESPP